MPNPTHFSLTAAIRPNILELTPYRCARDDYSEGILLDANENALGHSIPSNQEEEALDALDLNRYPSPVHADLKQQIGKLRGIPDPVSRIFLGVGSDEAIDILFRITCRPGIDRVLICPPTYGMYSVCAKINDVAVVKVPLGLKNNFLPQVDEINAAITAASKTPNPIKLIFLCSPGNPTGSLIPLADIKAVLSNPDFTGIVAVDEAYIDFAGGADGAKVDANSANSLLIKENWSNLVVMQTLSKGFGLAAIRLGIAFGSPEVIQVLNNIKAPYNISTPTADLAKRALSDEGIALFRQKTKTLIENREKLAEDLLKLPAVIQILGTNDANFLLTQIGSKNAEGTYVPDSELAQKIYTTMASSDKVVVRYRGNEPGCEGCLRITVGSAEENAAVLENLQKYLD